MSELRKLIDEFYLRDPTKLKKVIEKKHGKTFTLKQIRDVLDVKHAANPTKFVFPGGTHISNFPNQKWYIDLVDLSGGSFAQGWLLNVIDAYSRYAWSLYITNKQALTVWKAFEPLYNKYKPLIIVGDKGPEWSEIAKHARIKYGTPGYHLDTAPIERFNRTIVTMLNTAFEAGKRSEFNKNKQAFLDELTTQYNESKHSTTKREPELIFSGAVKSKAPQWVGTYNLKPGDLVKKIKSKGPFYKASRNTALSNENYKFIEMKDFKYLTEGPDGEQHLFRSREIQPVSAKVKAHLEDEEQERAQQLEQEQRNELREKQQQKRTADKLRAESINTVNVIQKERRKIKFPNRLEDFW
jgi:hypothetical protein